ncbi:GGDEF domain-containing protein [uncultured Clostridium sp.]|uniref:tetratricopeptide repeat-containing diguanylate cyclase n=1 Tax=uncultured Clostridium sp. TaxID=59620 RepID=UPI0025CDB13D|nr:GGDEF domain-containing protein [uncultured Clostridium sp.]
MEKFLNDIDNIIDDLEFHNIRFISNQLLNTIDHETTSLLKENKLDNIQVNIKINYLLGLINKLKLQIDCSISFFTKALELAKEIDDEVWLARIYSKLSLLSCYNNSSLVEHFSSTAIKYSKNIDSCKIKSFVYLEKIETAYLLKHPLLSVQSYMNEINDMLIDSQEKYVVRIFMALSFLKIYVLKDISKGLTYCEKALNLALKYNMLNEETIINLYISKFYMTYIIKAKDVIRILEPIILEDKYDSINMEIKVLIFLELTRAYLEEKRISKAEDGITFIVNNLSSISPILAKNVNIVLLYFKSRIELYNNNFKIALEYALECEDLYNDLEINHRLFGHEFDLKTTLCEIYSNLDDYKKAITYCTSLLEKEDTFTVIMKKKLYFSLGELYEKTDDYYLSFIYFNKYVSIHTSMIQDDLILIYERYQKELENKYKTHVIESLYNSNTVMIKDAYIDKLTKVLNKNYLLENQLKFNDAISIGVIMLDIDYFKKYNDGYGHIKGDIILSSVASKIKDICGDNNIVIRYGGEEFLIISYNIDKLSLKILGETICNQIHDLELEHNFSEVSNYVTVSVGCYYKILDKNDTYTNLIELADSCLYEAKKNGRNQCVIN